jgi:hypothetical protein
MRTAIAWGVFVVLTGCGGDGRPEISTSQDSVCDDVAQVACFDMYQCCSEGEIERALGVSDPRTEAECLDDVHAICRRQLATFDFSIKNKHVRFDPKAMNACLEAFVAPADACVTISAVKPWTAACMAAAWVGIVDNGGACDFAYECATNSFCNQSRICTALPSDGMPCAVQGCASGLFCDLGTCHPLLAQGAACTSTTQCQKTLFCDTAATVRTCTPLHAIGETCNGNASCASSTCLPGTCANSLTTCFTDTNCGGRCADDNSLCNTDGACAFGTCSGTATTCFSQADCQTPGSTCVFPVKCVLNQCVGPVVCGEAHLVIDYCKDAVNELPLF